MKFVSKYDNNQFKKQKNNILILDIVLKYELLKSKLKLKC